MSYENIVFSGIAIWMFAFLLIGCCAIKPNTKDCDCKKFEKFIQNNFKIDKTSGSGYIDESIKPITFKNRVALESISIIKDNLHCFEGVDVSRIRNYLSLPQKYKRGNKSYFYYTSIEAFKCAEQNINCDSFKQQPNLIINFVSNSVIEKADFSVKGGLGYELNLY